MKKALLSSVLLILFANLFAQNKGNSVYKKRNNYGDNNINQVRNFSSTDTTLTIEVNVLLNQKADKFMLTLGVSQEGKTPKECIAAINARIENVISKLEKLGIKRDEIFVDFISQTRIYDYDLKEKQAEEKEKGFELKKNLIIRINKFDNIEKIVSEVSEYQIFDIVKVDYINDNIDGIYEKLLIEAKTIADKKRDSYLKKFNPKIIGEPLANDNFYYVFPKSQYQEYNAFESAEIENYSSSSYVKKVARKSKTFYYEGLEYSGFDKVINNADPEVGIQYVLSLSVKYNVSKSK